MHKYIYPVREDETEKNGCSRHAIHSDTRRPGPQPCLDLEYPPKAHVLMAWSPACEAGGTL
jgi:hypothetical protein